jgi:hypothetical protein
MRLAKEKTLTYINGYDHPHIIAGQGTMGLEIVEQVWKRGEYNNHFRLYNLPHLFQPTHEPPAIQVYLTKPIF